MPLIFGLDIGTTSIGFAVIDHDSVSRTGAIRRMGVRIFPEARNSKGVPLNQERRAARMRRRQLRRRRQRRRRLGDILFEAGLLPARDSSAWQRLMKETDPYDLRRRAAEGEALPPHDLGRALYHLAQRRHFKGRDIDEVSDDTVQDREDADEKKAQTARDRTRERLKEDGGTLGSWLARISHNVECIGVLHMRKFFCDKGLIICRGVPRCRQSVVWERCVLHALKGARL